MFVCRPLWKLSFSFLSFSHSKSVHFFARRTRIKWIIGQISLSNIFFKSWEILFSPFSLCLQASQAFALVIFEQLKSYINLLTWGGLAAAASSSSSSFSSSCSTRMSELIFHLFTRTHGQTDRQKDIRKDRVWLLHVWLKCVVFKMSGLIPDWIMSN